MPNEIDPWPYPQAPVAFGVGNQGRWGSAEDQIAHF